MRTQRYLLRLRAAAAQREYPQAELPPMSDARTACGVDRHGQCKQRWTLFACDKVSLPAQALADDEDHRTDWT